MGKLAFALVFTPLLAQAQPGILEPRSTSAPQSSAVPRQNSSPDRSVDYLADGLKALDAKQPAAAEPLLRKAVEADPASVEASFSLALVLGMEGKDVDAIPAYQKVLELRPELYEANLNLGIVLLRDRQPADALVVLKTAADLKPGEFRPQLLLGNALYDTGDYEQAESQFRKAFQLDPKSAPAELALARSLLKQSKLAEAAERYRAAIALDPASKNSLIELGAEYDRLGRTTEAIAIFREFPANEAVSTRLTQLLLDSDNAAAAIPALEAAVKRSPTTKNRLTLADAYKQAGAHAKVLEQIQLAAAADPGNFDVRMAYGRLLRDDHKSSEAIAEFQAASQLQPDSAPALNELAGALILTGRFDEGLAALDRVHVLGKEIPGNIYLRAITLDKLHRTQPALDAYRQFLAVSAGKSPNEEFLARQRARIIGKELGK